MHNESQVTGRVRAIMWAVLAVVVSVAMLFVCSTPAMAENTAAGITDTGAQGAQSVDGSQTVKQGGAQEPQSDASSNGSAADSGESPSVRSDADDKAAAVADGQDACDNVLTWQTLAGCVSGTTSQTVTIAQTITVPETAKVPTINRAITLTAKPGVDPALTSQTNGDAIFNVAGGASLTIGTDTKDANFSYKNGKRSLVSLQGGGSLTVNNGTFSGIDTTGSTNHDMGTLAYSAGGTVTVNNGTFEKNTASRGGVAYSQGGSLTVNGGEFKDNTAKGGAEGGVFYQSSAEVIVNGGTFARNTAINGGVMYQTSDKASLAISGGTFEDNESKDAGNGGGGGVLFQMQGKTDITGGSFIGNRQTYTESCIDPSHLGPNSDLGPCRKGNSGGGAIHTEGGDLTIVGNVTFSGNYSKAYGWGDGGGAIFAKGTLWLRNDAKGTKPQFTANWSGIYDTQYDVDGKVPAGGAGGAIFLHTGTAYFMGGNFEGNTSGYLGGAVYTEEGTTSWIGKTAAKENIAGHFGGGLWLCPSGEGDASKGGNIALFDNSVDKNIDPNVQNMNPYIGTMKAGFTQTTVTYTQKDVDGVEAGADLAIMNPFWKNYEDRKFVLMDTWFTNRTESAVDWYEDGTPVRAASGYIDRYQSPKSTSKQTPEGTNLAVTKTDGRYSANARNVRIDLTSDDDDDDHVYTLTLSKDLNAAAPTYTTGVALTSVVKGDKAQQEKLKNAAWNGAAVTFSGNKARLSGGAFGTDGTVKFSTPYTASWSKVNESSTSTPKQQIGGAEWELTSNDGGGPFESKYFPGECPTDDNDASYNAGTCWKGSRSLDMETGRYATYTAKVFDNIGQEAYVGFDNNPEPGGFDLNNLANGTYTLKETKAPTGFEIPDPAANQYTFYVQDGQAKWDNATNGPTDKEIGNKPKEGLSWAKVDSLTGKEVASASTWTIAEESTGTNVTATPREIVDCVETGTGTCTTGDFKDTDPAVGQFHIEGLSTSKTYLLTEETAPDGYWKPGTGDATYQIKYDPTSKAMVMVDGKNQVMRLPYTIANERPNIAWTKADATDHNLLLEGSIWSIKGPFKDGNPIQETQTATVVDCVSGAGAQDPCSSHTNDLTGSTPNYADVDPGKGSLKVAGLDVPSGAKGDEEYTYELKETSAPDGYVKFDRTYTFTVGATKATSSLTLCRPSSTGADASSNGGCVPGTNTLLNVKAVSALPFTGGRDARDWLLFGGIAAVAAAITLAVINEYRKRKGLA